MTETHAFAPQGALVVLPDGSPEARLLAAWNAHDTTGLAEFVADDVFWVDPILAEPLRGVQAVSEFMQSCWRAMPDLHFVLNGPPCVAADAPVMTVAWTMIGTFERRFDPRGIGPTGRRGEVDGVDEYIFRDNKIAHYVAYYDTASFMRQLGLLPAPGTMEERVFLAVQRFRIRLRSWHR